MTLPNRSRYLNGLLYPMILLLVGMGVLAILPSKAAAEFAGLALLFMLILALPITVVINVALVQSATSARAAFKSGMIVPGLLLAAAALYQLGVWDTLI